MMSESAVFAVVLVLLVALSGVLMAITPWLMPRGECFTVTVPESAAGDSRFRALKRRFLIIVLAVTAVSAFAIATRVPLLRNPSMEGTFVWMYVAATLLPLAVGFILMIRYRAKVQSIKLQEGWQAHAQLSAAYAANHPDEMPRMLPLAWNLLYIPVLLLTAGLIAALYPSMPDQIPMQVDFAGNVTRSVAKSPASVSFPLLIELFMAIIFVFSHWSIGRSKPRIDPRKPATSAYAYAAYARAMCVVMVAGGLCLNAVLGVGMPLASAHRITLMQAGLWVVAAAMVFVVGSIVVALKYGQSGARLHARMLQIDEDGGAAEKGGMPNDEDRFWKLGVFYVNRNDAAFIVPKRFGVGWTVNFAHPIAWLLIAGLVLLIVLLSVVLGAVA